MHSVRDRTRLGDVRERGLCPCHVRSRMGRLQREERRWMRDGSLARDELRVLQDRVSCNGTDLRPERRRARVRIWLPCRRASPLRYDLRVTAHEHRPLRRMQSTLSRRSEGDERVRRRPVHVHVQTWVQPVQWPVCCGDGSRRLRACLHDLSDASEQHPGLHEQRVHVHLRGRLGRLQSRPRGRLRDEHDGRSSPLRRLRAAVRRHVRERPVQTGRRRMIQRRRSSGRAPCFASNHDVRSRRRKAEA
jgi:hypothetical protein